jgi:tetratricopeptide (TPR) repeat protein/class 3 adenylate cyclase
MEITGTGEHIVPEEREIPVVFVDLKGSSKLVAELHGRELAAKLDPWFNTVCNIFRGYHAEIKGRPGDCVVAAWTNPQVPFAPDRAVLAANRIKSATEKMSLAAHVGLHYGKCQIVQEREPLTDLPSIFGEASWIAARVQSKDKGGNVLATVDLGERVRIPTTWTARSEIDLEELGKNWQVRQLKDVGEELGPSTNPEALILYHWLEAEYEDTFGSTERVQYHCTEGLLSLSKVSNPEMLSLTSGFWKLLIDSLARQQKLQEAERCCQTVLFLSLTAVDRAHVWFDLGEVYQIRGDLGAAKQALSNALRLVPGGDANHLKANCLRNLGSIEMQIGDLKEAFGHIDQAKEIYEEMISNPHAEPYERYLCRLDLSTVYFYEYRRLLEDSHQRFGEAFAKLKECIDQLKGTLGFFKVRHLKHFISALNNLGSVAMEKRLFADAESYFTRAFWLAKEINDGVLEKLALKNLGVLHINRQRLPEGALLTVSNVTSLGDSDLSSRDKDDFDLGILWHQKGREYEKLDAIDEALRCFSEAARYKRNIATEASLGNSLHMIGVIYAKRHDWVNAERHFLESLWIDAQETNLEGVKRSVHDFGTLSINQGNRNEGDLLHASTRALIEWETDRDPDGVSTVLEALEKLPETYPLRNHIKAAVEMFFERGATLHKLRESGIFRVARPFT